MPGQAARGRETAQDARLRRLLGEGRINRRTCTCTTSFFAVADFLSVHLFVNSPWSGSYVTMHGHHCAHRHPCMASERRSPHGMCLTVRERIHRQQIAVSSFRTEKPCCLAHTRSPTRYAMARPHTTPSLRWPVRLAVAQIGREAAATVAAQAAPCRAQEGPPARGGCRPAGAS